LDPAHLTPFSLSAISFFSFPSAVRTKVTLVLVFLNVALFFFIFTFERSWRTEAASREARRRVLGPESADISMLEVTSTAPGGSFKLARQKGNWMLVEPIDWPANETAVSSIVHELQLLEHEASFAVAELAQTKQSIADYGLDQPKLTVAFRSGSGDAGALTVLRIGDTTSVGNRLYVLSPDGQRIHIVNRSLADSLSMSLEQLRAETLLTIPVFEARSLSVQAAATGEARQAQAPTPGALRIRIRRDGARWTFESPVIARASKLEVDRTINQLNALHPKTFNPPGAPSIPPSSAAFLRITLEGNNRYETLYLGEPVTPVPDREEAAQIEYYAQLEDRRPVFTVMVPRRLTDILRNAPLNLRERRILDFDPRSVRAITLSAPVQSSQAIELQRLEDTTAGIDGGWQVVRRGDAQGPQTRAADTAQVQRLLSQLMLLSAKSFESDAPTSADLENWGFNRPEREVTLTLDGSATPLVLRLGTDARREVYARSGAPSDPGLSIVSVDADILREVRPDVLAWRNRVLHELPAAARIIALKIVNLPDQEVLFEASFDGAGEPTAPVHDPAAVASLLSALRKLQAREFVRDSFVERVTVAGEFRPWRFRLDATVVLPGGTGAGQTSTLTLFLSERAGGTQQLAGSRDFDAVFALEQPLLDSIWALTYGPRDPGPPPQAKQ
jgi:hypothetical protein